MTWAQHEAEMATDQRSEDASLKTIAAQLSRACLNVVVIHQLV